MTRYREFVEKRLRAARCEASAKGLIARREKSDAVAREMLALMADGYPASYIAEKYGINESSVHGRLKRYRDRHE